MFRPSYVLLTEFIKEVSCNNTTLSADAVCIGGVVPGKESEMMIAKI